MPIHEGTQAIYRNDSGVVTAAGKAGLLYGYTLIAGAADSTVIFTDGGSGGTTKWKDSCHVAGDSASQNFTPPIAFSTDIYVTISGTGTLISVAYLQTT